MVTSYPSQKAESTVMVTWWKYQCRISSKTIDRGEFCIVRGMTMLGFSLVPTPLYFSERGVGTRLARLVVLELLFACFPNKSVAELQQHLSPADPSTPGLNQSYICKQLCFSSLEIKEKIKQLNDKVHATENEVFR